MFKNVFDKMYKVKVYKVKIYEMCAVGKTMIFFIVAVYNECKKFTLLKKSKIAQCMYPVL